MRYQLESDLVGCKAWIRSMEETERKYRQLLTELAAVQVSGCYSLVCMCVWRGGGRQLLTELVSMLEGRWLGEAGGGALAG